jgi:hypothetical protein
MKKIPLFLALLLPLKAFTALPPLYESLREYKAVLENPELSQKLSSADFIEQITKTEEGFLIKTNKQTLQVKLIPLPQNRPGPLNFHLIFEEPLDRV